jgi:hypothetical protein
LDNSLQSSIVGIEPHQRRQHLGRSHLEHRSITAAATDFFTAEVCTATGLTTFYVLFIIQLQTRRIILAGLTPIPINTSVYSENENPPRWEQTKAACSCSIWDMNHYLNSPSIFHIFYYLNPNGVVAPTTGGISGTATNRSIHESNEPLPTFDLEHRGRRSNQCCFA